MIAFLALLEELKSGSAQVPPLPIPPPQGGRGAQDAAPGTSPPPRGEGMGVGGAAVDPWARFLANAGPQEVAAAQRLMAGQRPRRVAGLDAILAWAAEAAGVPPWLAAESLAATGGDRAETAALLLPDPTLPAPSLAEVLARLEACGTLGARATLLDIWQRLPAPGRVLVNRLASGTFRPRKPPAAPAPLPQGPQRRVRAVMTQALPASREIVLALLKGNELVPVTRLRLSLPEAPALFTWVRDNVAERFGPVRTLPATQVFDLAFTATRPNPRRKCGLDLLGAEILAWLGPDATPDSVSALVPAPDLEQGGPSLLDDTHPSGE